MESECESMSMAGPCQRLILVVLFALAFSGVASSEQPDPSSIMDTANQGDAQTEFQIGLAYQLGNGVAPNAEEAAKWDERAAAQNLPGAEVNLGALYEFGDGVPQDSARALALYQQAADQGDRGGERALGTAYEQGKIVARDDTKASEWLLRAAKQGDKLAELQISGQYERGEGVPQDDTEAVRWATAAAEQREPMAELTLGLTYDRGLDGVAIDYGVAAKWLTQGLDDVKTDTGRAWAAKAYPAELVDLLRRMRRWNSDCWRITAWLSRRTIRVPSRC